MANDLYDTGAPKRIIVEQHVTHTHEVVQAGIQCQDCGRSTRSVPCEWCGNGAPPKKRKAVTITPQFETVPEKKSLLPAPAPERKRGD